jgi:hypothetical protein
VADLSPTRTLAYLLILAGGLLGVLYWGALAWRDPAKFKEMSLFSFLSNDNWFAIALWSFRILVLLIGLTLLISIAIMLVLLVGMME